MEISIRNPHKKSGMNSSLIELLREWSVTKVEVVGPVGGISGGGAARLFSSYLKDVRSMLSESGFRV